MYSNQKAKALFPELSELRLGADISEMDFLPFDFSSLSHNESSFLEFSTKIDGICKIYNLSVNRMAQENST